MDIYGNVNVIGPRTVIHFDTNLNSTYSYNGFTCQELVGEDILNREIVYFNFTASKWFKAKSDSYATMPGLGVALQNATINTKCLILRYGFVFSTTWHFTSSNLYISHLTPGEIITTRPNLNGTIVQQIGTAYTSQIAFLDFNTTTIECTNY